MWRVDSERMVTHDVWSTNAFGQACWMDPDSPLLAVRVKAPKLFGVSRSDVPRDSHPSPFTRALADHPTRLSRGDSTGVQAQNREATLSFDCG